MKALGFNPGCLFQSLCSSLCATLPQRPSPSHLPGPYTCPYSILHLRKKAWWYKQPLETIKSDTLILSLSLPIHQPLSPTTHDISWNFWFFSIHTATSTWVHLTRISRMDYCNRLRVSLQHSGLLEAMFVPNPPQVPFHTIAVWKTYGQVTRAGKLDSPKSWSQSLGQPYRYE